MHRQYIMPRLCKLTTLFFFHLSIVVRTQKKQKQAFFLKKKLKYLNTDTIFAFIESKQTFLPDLGLFDELMSIVSFNNY